MFHLMNGQFGKIKFLNETMSVYRVHEGGFWSVHQDERKVMTLKERIYLLENFNDYSNSEYSTEIKASILKCKVEILIEEVAKGIELEQQQKSRLVDLLNTVINKRSIYVFGSGRAGQKTTAFLTKLGFEVCGFLDNDSKKCGLLVNGLKVFNPTDFNYDQNIIFIASEFYKEISEQLNSFGLTLNTDYQMLFQLLSNELELFA